MRFIDYHRRIISYFTRKYGIKLGALKQIITVFFLFFFQTSFKTTRVISSALTEVRDVLRRMVRRGLNVREEFGGARYCRDCVTTLVLFFREDDEVGRTL